MFTSRSRSCACKFFCQARIKAFPCAFIKHRLFCTTCLQCFHSSLRFFCFLPLEDSPPLSDNPTHNLLGALEFIFFHPTFPCPPSSFPVGQIPFTIFFESFLLLLLDEILPLQARKARALILSTKAFPLFPSITFGGRHRSTFFLPSNPFFFYPL